MRAVRPKNSYLTQTFGGYYASEVPPEDEELTHVGPGTPCGEYLRRFWHPVAHVEDLEDHPIPIRILGEDLVLFRDGCGRIGLLSRHCPHRGTSLAYGIIAERGIKCCYHGWHFDVDGRILDTPGEPADSTLKDRLCTGAYPTHEYNDLVFTYMGPPETKPVFPILDTFELPGFELGHGEPLGDQERQALQLATDNGQRRRSGARGVPARSEQRLSVPRQERSAGDRPRGSRRVRLRRDADRNRLSGHAKGGSRDLGSNHRIHLSQHRTDPPAPLLSPSSTPRAETKSVTFPGSRAGGYPSTTPTP